MLEKEVVKCRFLLCFVAVYGGKMERSVPIKDLFRCKLFPRIRAAAINLEKHEFGSSSRRGISLFINGISLFINGIFLFQKWHVWTNYCNHRQLKYCLLPFGARTKRKLSAPTCSFKFDRKRKSSSRRVYTNS